MIRPVRPAVTRCQTIQIFRLLPKTIIPTLLIWTITVYARADIFERPYRMQGSTDAGDVAVLEQGKPVERELVGGEAHVYQLALTARQYARVTVDQRGIDLAVAVFDPDGRKIIETDIARLGDPETVSLVTETPVSYRLEVRSTDKTAPKGRYEIKITELRTATEQDKSLQSAEKLSAEAMALYRQQTADSRRKAIEKYQQSIPYWQSAKNPFQEAVALYMIGQTWIDLGEREKALDSCNKALLLARSSGDLNGQAYALDTIGRVYDELGDKRKALEMFNQALPLRRAVGSKAREAFTLNNIAMAHGWMGEWPLALDYFNQVREVFSALGDRRDEAVALSNICFINTNLGQYKTALDACSQSLAISRDLNNRGVEAITLDNIGSVYSNSGRYQEALDSYNGARAIYKDSGNRKSEAIALNNIGWVYATLGEYQKGIDFYNQALPVFRDLGDQYREATALSNIGVNYANLGEYQKALDIHFQLLPVRRATRDSAGESITLSNIAHCYSKLRETQKALDYYGKAITLQRAIGSQRQLATSLRNVGALYREMGDQQKAFVYLNEGLQVSRAIGDQNAEAGTLSHIARLERDRGNLPEARNRIEAALAAVESLRINIKSHQLRASYFASVRNYHEFYIDLLMQLHKQRPSEGFDGAALQASEKGRARSLLELLAEAGAEIRRDLDPALIEREQNLRLMISDKAERRMRAPNPDQSAASARDIDTLVTEYEQLQARIRQASPRYARLTEPAPLTLKQIQIEVLDEDTLLLEYTLGEEKSFLWAVTPASINAFELPKRAEIEQAARAVYEILTARNKVVSKETPEQRRKRLGQADADYPKTSAALSRMLLGPVAAQMNNKRLLIVSEGLLQYIPFATLENPVAAQPRPIILDHEIVTLPSASVLSVLRHETAGRKAADKTIAVFADPVFDSRDPRIGSLSRTAVEKTEVSISDVRRSATESGLRDFVRLRFSRQEADQIAGFAAEGRKLKAVDFAASRATVTNSDLGRYRILHFATHGVINNQHPDLSGIVLSLVDEQGRPQNGFLRLYDIYNLKLEADLVVLSACQTALGKEIKGEGLVGLTRGFMYAGAPRVVTTLWQIDDRATAEFMRRFYEEMLGRGLRPAAALRSAQISMQKDKRWGAPYYWAAFTLQGEWR
ncbi:MAG: CHAT domain-containing tetratricopeptide repeat protein [Blastocatellia bacterium]